jgi:hypothetical protein
MTSQPDGKAAAHKTVPSGFDSHRRLFEARFATPFGACGILTRLFDLGLCVPSMGSDDDDVADG